MRRLMIKRLFVLATVVVLHALIVSSVSVVGASEPQAISGTWQFVSVTPISAQPVGGNCIIELEATLAFHGDLEGSSTNQVRIVHLGPCDQPASEIAEVRGTYEGTVATASGTFDNQSQVHADAQGNAQAQLVILTGTGGLANLHGQITLTGQIGGGGTYSGDIHFDP